MLGVCSGEQFKLKERAVLQLSESLATRDFSASSSLSRTGTGERMTKSDDAHVDEAESTLREAISLNYEEARALLGRLEYQKGNFEAALHVFKGIDIITLSPKMSKAITERTQQHFTLRPKGENVPPNVMSLHSVSLLLEAILLKAKSLEGLNRVEEAARECKTILDIVESALPNGMPESIGEECKLEEMFHKALDLLPKLWIKAGFLNEAIIAYRRTLVTPWNLDTQILASKQKDLATILLYGGVEESLPPHLKLWGPSTPTSNTEEAILLLFILMRKVFDAEIEWDREIIDHLTFGLSICGQFEALASQMEEAYTQGVNCFLLALCYSAAGQNEAALNLLKNSKGRLEGNHNPHFPFFLLGAKLCAQDPKYAQEGINFAKSVIELAYNLNGHFLNLAHKFLGVCYGNAAIISISDSERILFQGKSMETLNTALIGNEDPEVIFSLALENAQQRNLNAAFGNAMLYSNMMGGSSARGWKLLVLIVSAEQRLKDAEELVDLALQETGRIEQMEFLRLKAVLQIAQEQPNQAIETYKILLALIQAQREHQTDNLYSEGLLERRLEMEAWLDIAKIYSDLELWPDAEICVDKSKSIEFHSPRGWHAKGVLFEAQSLHEEALIAFSASLSIDPDYVPSIVSTAQVLMKAGGTQTLPIARSLLMNALRLEPTNHGAWSNLGSICKREGKVQQAADFFQAAYELESTAPVQSFV
ncbi:hypothetical protein LguiB_017379 [Lonicera macranthoides]